MCLVMPHGSCRIKSHGLRSDSCLATPTPYTHDALHLTRYTPCIQPQSQTEREEVEEGDLSDLCAYSIVTQVTS